MKLNEISRVFATGFGVLLLIGGLWIAGVYFHAWVKWYAARNWEELPCSIESIELHSAGQGHFFNIEAQYQYQYQGRVYHGDRVDFFPGGDTLSDYHRRIHLELLTHIAGNLGKDVLESVAPDLIFHCYVNPNNPADAVLYRHLRWDRQAFLAAFIILIPTAGVRLTLRGFHPTQSPHYQQKQRGIASDRSMQSNSPETEALNTGRSRSQKMGLYIFTIWSGIISLPLIATSQMGDIISTRWVTVFFSIFFLFFLVLSLTTFLKSLRID